MKFKINLIVLKLVVFTLLFGCNMSGQVNDKNIKSSSTQIGNYEVKLKSGIDSSILSINDFETLYSSNTRSLTLSVFTSFTLEDLTKIYKETISKYNLPDITNKIDIINNIKIDATGITEKDIEKYFSEFVELYKKQCLWAYIVKINSAESLSRGGTYPGGLYGDEFFLLLLNPWQIELTARASKDAVKYTKSKFGGSRWGDQSDAFRHSIWNALLASYCGGDKKGRLDWAKRFSDAHESGAAKAGHVTTNWDNPMDYHNNRVGRDIWNSLAREKQVWWWKEVTPPSNTTLINTLYNKAISGNKLTKKEQISLHRNNLVYFR